MNSKTISILAVLMMCLPVFAAADVSAVTVPQIVPEEDAADETDYVTGEILVKDRLFSQKQLNVPYRSAEPLFAGSHWHKVVLDEGIVTLDALNAVKASGVFEDADLNYRHTLQNVDVSGNPEAGRSTYFDSMGIGKAWDALVGRGVSPGGDRSIVIGIVDTGVDYEHEDLKDNIWHNEDEIPGNGIDDDGNGYVDDVIGWDFGEKDGDPMDKEGHGTHVAGIAAAVDNDKGTVGVAFNCRIMPLKCADAKGDFSDATIAEAVHYAAQNGAQVVNMSLGGPNMSKAAMDAITDNADRCIVVAAAGNETRCSNPDHASIHASEASYPGCLPSVIGVMSTLKDGTEQSWFSNFDDTPYDSLEYDVYAAGSEIYSTWPGNAYNTLNGTSMACPVVTGITALLLSADTDRTRLSLDDVRAALVNTGSVHPYNKVIGEDDAHHFLCDAFDALDPEIRPFVNAMTPCLSDSKMISEKNNQNGIADAGETVQVGADLMNRGFDALTARVTLECSDPFVRYTEGILGYGDIPTYRTAGCGFDGDPASTIDRSFDLEIDPDCPDSHVVEFRLLVSYEDPSDPDRELNTVREGSFEVRNTRVLEGKVTSDTVFGATQSYIIKGIWTVGSGVSVTFTEGARITMEEGAGIRVDGTLNMLGTDDRRVSLKAGPGLLDLGAGDSKARFVCVDMEQVAPVCEGDPAGRMSFDRCDLETKLIPSSGVRVMLADFRDSVLHGMCAKLTVNGMSGSQLNLSSNVNELRFIGAPVEDCVFILDTGDVTDSTVRFGADLRNVLFADTSDEIGEFDMVVEDGVTLTDVCFETNLAEYAVDPHVPVSGLDADALWPYMTGFSLIDENGRAAEEIANLEYTLRLQFSKDMDPASRVKVGFSGGSGSVVYDAGKGSFVSDRTYECALDLTRFQNPTVVQLYIEGGSERACPFKTAVSPGMSQSFEMKKVSHVDAWVEPRESGPGAEIWFDSEEFEKATGINVYRSDSIDGPRTRINDVMLPNYFVSIEDPDAVPGRTYWYCVTSVDMNMKESVPDRMIEFTVPEVETAPMGSVFAGTDVRLSCRVTGDIDPTEVTLRYDNGSGWRSAETVRDGDTFTGVIPAEDVKEGAVRYYFSATDGEHTVTGGTADDPYTLEAEHRDTVPTVLMSVLLILLSAVLIAVSRR